MRQYKYGVELEKILFKVLFFTFISYYYEHHFVILGYYH